MKRDVLSAAVVGLLLAASLVAQAQSGQKPLTNLDLMNLVRAGFSDTFIEMVIERAEHNFDISAEGKAALRHEGVSDRLIATVSRYTAQAKPVSNSNSPGRTSAGAVPAPAVPPQVIAAPVPREVPAARGENQTPSSPVSVTVKGSAQGGSVELQTMIVQLERQFEELQRRYDTEARELAKMQNLAELNRGNCNDKSAIGTLNCIGAKMGERNAESSERSLRQLDLEMQNVQGRLNALRLAAATGSVNSVTADSGHPVGSSVNALTMFTERFHFSIPLIGPKDLYVSPNEIRTPGTGRRDFRANCAELVEWKQNTATNVIGLLAGNPTGGWMFHIRLKDGRNFNFTADSPEQGARVLDAISRACPKT
jgi:hypothetical protein